MLRADAVEIRVGERVLVRALDLVIGAGERWAVLGRNGAGKSTLLHVLAGLRAPRAGRVTINGHDIGTMSRRDVARSAGILLQEETREYWGRARDYATLGRYPHQHGIFGPGESDHAIVAQALAAMDMQDISDRAYRSLSGGERQRARLAALIAQQPACYLCDEPLQQLDLAHQIAFLDWISGEVRSRQSACLMVMHDLVLAFRYCDHALLLFGDGSYTKGRREEMMTEENLRLLYGFPVKVCTVGEDFIFLPARSDSPAQL